MLFESNLTELMVCCGTAAFFDIRLLIVTNVINRCNLLLAVASPNSIVKNDGPLEIPKK